jgi:cytochrome P450
MFPIDAGERLSLMWIAADRDPRSFDAPEELRLDRNPDDNLVFGAGIHICAGAPLARLELRVAFDELLKQTLQIDRASNDSPEREVYPSNGVKALSVRLTT